MNQGQTGDRSACRDRPTVCLNMIVRDESQVIEECLAAVVDRIDHWVIVDTGSTDDTMERIRAFFAERAIEGELFERPWTDFGTNRTQAIELAAGRADYTWVIDADDLLVGDLDLSGLEADAYQVRYGIDFIWWRTQIFRSSLPWTYRGVLHEYPHCAAEPCRIERLDGGYQLLGRTMGGRSQVVDKYERDAVVLEAAHSDDPDDPRTVFYLAQSHRDAGHAEKAIGYYERRIEMGGWDEETYVARLERARCLDRLDRWPEAQAAYLEAWASRPHRGEALHDLARHHRLADEFALAHLFAAKGVDLPVPEDDLLFVSIDVHRWRLLDEASISAFYIGRPDQTLAWCRQLLDGGDLPASERPRVEANLEFAVEALRTADADAG